jgi:Tol biopolymer transport system component
LGIKDLHGGNGGISVLPRGEAQARALLTGGEWYDYATFNRDGSAVILQQQSSTTTLDGDIVAVSTVDRTLTTIVGGPTNDVAPALSPDGATLAFSRSPSVTITGAFDRLATDKQGSDLYVVPLVGGEPRLIATDVWPGVTWSPDSTRILARTPDWRELLILPIIGSDPVHRLNAAEDSSPPSWQVPAT